jgi:SAM-dependent methyltransferase
MTAKPHWENVYGTKSHKDVSWYADHVEVTPAWIHDLKLSPDAALIDVGGGASTWVDDMLGQGFHSVTVLDISGAALNIAKARLGERASTVHWLEADVREQSFAPQSLDLWHDRAVFHFLTEESDRERYRAQVFAALKPGGYLLFSIFADDGPEKCSMLPVRRHSEAELATFFAESMEVVRSERGVHKTPGGAEQRFVTVLLRKT